jgi:hypothetical protein
MSKHSNNNTNWYPAVRKFVTQQIKFPNVCKICGKKLKSIGGLGNHLLSIHKLTYREYLFNYFNIDVDRLNEEYRNNIPENRKLIYLNSNLHKHSPDKTRWYPNVKEAVTAQINNPKLCKICNVEFKSITGLSSHLISKHNISYKKYILEYYNINVDLLNKEYEEKIPEIRRLGHIKAGESLKETHKKGNFLSENGAKNKALKIKGMHSLEWMINRYGEEEGTMRHKERCEKISKTSYFREYNKINKNNYSPISQELFWKIHNIIKEIFNKIYFGELNHEYNCGTPGNFDFVILDNKRVIEFNGDKWHANPNIYKESDIPLKFTNKTAAQIWQEDIDKNKKAIDNGYSLKIIWEKDYLRDKESVILDCIKFILSGG